VLNYKEHYLLFDGRSYSLLEIKPVTKDILPLHALPLSKIMSNLKGRYNEQEIIEANTDINQLIELGILSVKDDLCIESPTLDKLILLLDENCNLACRYCFENGKKNIEHSRRKMTPRTIDACYDFLFRNSKNKSVNIQFYGGEPLLNKDGLIYAVERGIERSSAKHKDINFLLITNGTLIDDKIAEFLSKNNVTVQISIDGDRKGHDANRVFKNGEGSYAHVRSGLEKLISYEVICNVMVVASKQVLDSVGWLQELSQKINGVLAISSSATENVELQPTDGQWQNFIKAYQRYISDSTNNYTSIDKSIYRIFKLYEQIKQGRRFYFGCGGGLSELTIGHDGTIYLCERMEMKTEYNVNNQLLKATDIWKPYINNISHKKCSKCWAKYLCGGGCAHTARTINGKLLPYKWDCNIKQAEIMAAIKILYNKRSRGEYEQ